MTMRAQNWLDIALLVISLGVLAWLFGING